MAFSYNVQARHMKEDALLRHRPSLAPEMAISVIIAFKSSIERSHQIQTRLPVVPVKLIERLEECVGTLPSFPSSLVAGGEIIAAVSIS